MVIDAITIIIIVIIIIIISVADVVVFIAVEWRVQTTQFIIHIINIIIGIINIITATFGVRADETTIINIHIINLAITIVITTNVATVVGRAVVVIEVGVGRQEVLFQQTMFKRLMLWRTEVSGEKKSNTCEVATRTARKPPRIKRWTTATTTPTTATTTTTATGETPGLSMRSQFSGQKVEEEGCVSGMFRVWSVYLKLVDAVGSEVAGVAANADKVWWRRSHVDVTPFVFRTTFPHVHDQLQALQVFVGLAVKLKVRLEVGLVLTQRAYVSSTNHHDSLFLRVTCPVDLFVLV